MKKSLSALCAVALAGTAAQAATVSVNDSSAPWLGYMNVFELPANGGAFLWGSGWGIADLNAVFDDGAGTVTMSPNTIGDPDPYWYQGGGAPGNAGNKLMEANMYQELNDGSLSGTNVNFSGEIKSNTFTSAHSATVFIRDYAADFSSFNETRVSADVGAFSIDLATDAGAGRVVQWGITVLGENVWFTDVAPFGSVVVSTVPAPGAMALLGLGGLAATRRRRNA